MPTEARHRLRNSGGPQLALEYSAGVYADFEVDSAGFVGLTEDFGLAANKSFFVDDGFFFVSDTQKDQTRGRLGWNEGEDALDLVAGYGVAGKKIRLGIGNVTDWDTQVEIALASTAIKNALVAEVSLSIGGGATITDSDAIAMLAGADFTGPVTITSDSQPQYEVEADGGITANLNAYDAANYAKWRLGRATGSRSIPAAVGSGDILGRVEFAGYDGASFDTAAYIQAVATQTFTGVAQGTRLGFFATPTGTATPTELLRLEDSGGSVYRSLTWETDASAVMDAGAVGAPSISWAGYLDLGFYRPVADAIGVSVAGAEVARFLATGLDVAGLITSAEWNGDVIATAYTAAKVTSIVAGTDIAVSGAVGDVTVNHADTSALLGTYGGSDDGVLVETITVDARGHVTAVATRDIDSRFVTSVSGGIGLTGTVTSSGSLDLDLNSLTAEATVDGAADYVAIWDVTAGAHRKVLLDDLPGGTGTVPDTRTITINGTSNEVEVAGGTQSFAANRTWTVGLPDDVTLAGDFAAVGAAFTGDASVTRDAVNTLFTVERTGAGASRVDIQAGNGAITMGGITAGVNVNLYANNTPTIRLDGTTNETFVLYDLDVADDLTVGGQVYAWAANAGAPTYSTPTATSSGLFFSSANPAISASGTLVSEWNATGMWVYGTANISGAIDVGGKVTIDGGAAHDLLRLESTDGVTLTFYDGGESAGFDIRVAGTGPVFQIRDLSATVLFSMEQTGALTLIDDLVVDGDVYLADGQKLYLDGVGGNDYWHHSGDNHLQLVTSGSPRIDFHTLGQTFRNTYQIRWSSTSDPAGVYDTNLYRNAANELKTDDDFIVGGDLTTGTDLFRAVTADRRVYINDGGGSLPALDGATVLVVQNNAAVGRQSILSIISGTSGVSSISMGDSDDENRGQLDYVQATDIWSWRAGASNDRMTLDSAGDWGIAGDADIAGALDVGGPGRFDDTVQISSASPGVKLIETDAAADNAKWLLRANGERFSITAMNDAQTVLVEAMQIERTGTVVDAVKFPEASIEWGGGAAIASSDDVVTAGHEHSAADITSGTLATARGGTGLASYVAGDILYASAANVLSVLAKGADGEVLTLASGVPSWAAAGVGPTTGESMVMSAVL